MGKKKKFEFPSVEKIERIGFQDGYAGRKSQENVLIGKFCKRGINKEQIKSRILAYALGYKKGKLLKDNSIDVFKIKNGQVAINGKVIELDNNKDIIVEEKIKNHPVKTKRKEDNNEKF